VFAEGAVGCPLNALLEWDTLDAKIGLLADDSESRARGSRRRLISRMKVKDWVQASLQDDAGLQISNRH